MVITSVGYLPIGRSSLYAAGTDMIDIIHLEPYVTEVVSILNLKERYLVSMQVVMRSHLLVPPGTIVYTGDDVVVDGNPVLNVLLTVDVIEVIISARALKVELVLVRVSNGYMAELITNPP